MRILLTKPWEEHSFDEATKIMDGATSYEAWLPKKPGSKILVKCVARWPWGTWYLANGRKLRVVHIKRVVARPARARGVVARY